MVTSEMKEKARADIREAFIRLGYPELNDRVRVEWNPRFSSKMGDARYISMTNCRIRLSEPLWPRATEAERRHTAIHEACHIVVGHEYSLNYLSSERPKPHGKEWKEKMIECGEAPTRCHNVDTNGVKNSRKKFVYHCDCPGEAKIHRVGPVKHRRIQTGQQYYICKKCKGILRKPGQPAPQKPEPKNDGLDMVAQSLAEFFGL